MTRQQRKAWTRAYQASHVCADICERVLHAGVIATPEREDWLMAEAKDLLVAARALRRAGCRRKWSKTKPTNERNRTNEKR